MPPRKRLIPDVVADQQLVTLKPSDTARDAAVLMDRREVSSVMIVDENDRLAGIFTVRDVARRVVGGHLDPDTTPLSQVMTRDPTCVGASERPHRALRLMQDGRFRHLPVTEDGTPNGTLVGVVSRRNFFPEDEALIELEDRLWETIR